MNDIIELTFTSASPTLVLVPVQPSEAPAAFSQVLVGAKGDPGTAGDADNIEGFTTNPLFYYILASN